MSGTLKQAICKVEGFTRLRSNRYQWNVSCSALSKIHISRQRPDAFAVILPSRLCLFPSNFFLVSAREPHPEPHSVAAGARHVPRPVPAFEVDMVSIVGDGTVVVEPGEQRCAYPALLVVVMMVRLLLLLLCVAHVASLSLSLLSYQWWRRAAAGA